MQSAQVPGARRSIGEQYHTARNSQCPRHDLQKKNESDAAATEDGERGGCRWYQRDVRRDDVRNREDEESKAEDAQRAKACLESWVDEQLEEDARAAEGRKEEADGGRWQS